MILKVPTKQGQEIVGLPLKWATAKAARRGASGPNNDIFTEEKRDLKGSSLLKHKGQKVARQRKSIMVKNKQRLL